MKVFMSWSGGRSKAVAELLHYWIKCVVQASQPWISTSGIDSGSIWFNQINNELKDTTFGIICLTQENKESPWILFEAGALAKGLASSRVCTFLIDLGTKDIRDPLAQFNHTLPDKDSLWKLVSTLNSSLETNRLELSILKGVFETYWPQFESNFNKILDEIPEVTVVPPRSENEILEEILEGTRGLERRMRALENSSMIHTWDHIQPKKRNRYTVNSIFDTKSYFLHDRPSQQLSIDDLRALCTLLVEKGLSRDEVSKLLHAVVTDSEKDIDEIVKQISILSKKDDMDSGAAN